MASRFYSPVEEEALDPRYNEESSPFAGDDQAAYDTPQESPFAENSPSGAPPPSVEQSKAAKPKGSPFDTPDPRLTELDEQIKSRPRSIGGMIAAFSPQGDKSLANLMAQRHMYGQEVHGDRQLQRQLENSRLINESQNKHWETLARNADVMAAQREATARALAQSRVDVQGSRNEGNLATQGVRNQGTAAVQGLRNSGGIAQQGLKNEGAVDVQGLRNQGSIGLQGLKNQGMIAGHQLTTSGQLQNTQLKSDLANGAEMPTEAPSFGPATLANGTTAPDGTTGNGGKYVAKGGVWRLNQ